MKIKNHFHYQLFIFHALFFFSFLVWHVLLTLVMQLTGKPSASCPSLAHYMAVWLEHSQGVHETENRAKSTNAKQTNNRNVCSMSWLLHITGPQSSGREGVRACVCVHVCLCVGQKGLPPYNGAAGSWQCWFGSPSGCQHRTPATTDTRIRTRRGVGGGRSSRWKSPPVLPTQITSSD